MNDTAPSIAALVERRFAAMTPGQRVQMAVQMCNTSRQIVMSSFAAGLTPLEKKRQLCARYYGDLALLAFPLGASDAAR
jgi:hypothetical protein